MMDICLTGVDGYRWRPVNKSIEIKINTAAVSEKYAIFMAISETT